MITVTNLMGQTELLNNFQRFEINEEINGSFTISFTSFFVHNNPGHALIKEESIITVDGYEFRVKQLKESHNRKDVTAISTFYDLTGYRQELIYGGTRTFNEFANFVFGGSGWTFTSNVTGSVLIPNYGEENVVKLVQALCQAFECEYKIMPGKHIDFAKEIGPDNDAQYRYGHNVQALYKSVDTTNMRTRITGRGGAGLTVTYTSPNAKLYGISEAEPFNDERFTISDSLLEKIKQEIRDYPETTIELDSIELMDKALGERVWLIYEPLGIEYQTRVMSKKSVIRNGKLVTASVVIGNTAPRTLSDILTTQKVEIDENKKETRSKFEQTNDRITMEVETIGETIATLEIKSDNIILQVEAIEESVATLDIKADNITLSVSNLNGRVGSAEAQLSVQAGEISSKVSYTNYNGDEILSRVSQTASTFKVQAKNIEMDGITTVAHTLYIGGDFRDSASKALQFRGSAGGVGVFSDRPDDLTLSAINNLNLDASWININSNASVTGLYARFG